MQCSDHPLTNRKNGVNISKKNGIHIFYPDVVVDRRKLIEIRTEALHLCDFFAGSINKSEEIFDEAVYKVKLRFS